MPVVTSRRKKYWYYIRAVSQLTITPNPRLKDPSKDRRNRGVTLSSEECQCIAISYVPLETHLNSPATKTHRKRTWALIYDQLGVPRDWKISVERLSKSIKTASPRLIDLSPITGEEAP